MKQLSELINGIKPLQILGSAEIAVKDITADSSKVSEGSVFVAVPGSKVDGHQFVSQAIASGAVAVIVEKLPDTILETLCYVVVSNSRLTLGIVASAFYDHPSAQMRLVGVTGTNGKTTIATLLYKLYRGLGYKAGLFSTVCNRINDETLESTHTTPDPVRLNEIMRRMVDSGCDYCFMEVSSHAVDQHRIAGLHYRGGIFTNLTRDHLDYHKTFEAYLKAKKGFFDGLDSDAFALTNTDDRNGSVMTQNTAAKVYTYSMQSMADFKGHVLENQLNGLQMTINGTEAWFRLTGLFNAYNLLAIYGAACADGQDAAEVLRVLSGLEAVEGRFDTLRSTNGVTAVVDYAHTPDAVKNVLDTLRELTQGSGKIITVVGAGGDRDPGKRPMMARIACELSDQVILTSDNPRSEDPDKILDDMRQGVDVVHSRKVLCITDRKEAIRTACTLAQPQDVILVAGKGHEKYQDIKGVKHPFDDKEILREFLIVER
jgi:UDP-N-acetylmuramoyl-L-alanyl-D-glutamate--2,6-diaminopimelate ligase